MNLTFGERLRALREAQKLSVGQLAMKVGVTEGAIRQMESGQTKSASFGVGVKLAVALNVPPIVLAFGAETVSKATSVRGQADDKLSDYESLPISLLVGENEVAIRPYSGLIEQLTDESRKQPLHDRFEAASKNPDAVTGSLMMIDAKIETLRAVVEPMMSVVDDHERGVVHLSQRMKFEGKRSPSVKPQTHRDDQSIENELRDIRQALRLIARCLGDDPQPVDQSDQEALRALRAAFDEQDPLGRD